jgi:hypothetical protein
MECSKKLAKLLFSVSCIGFMTCVPFGVGAAEVTPSVVSVHESDGTSVQVQPDGSKLIVKPDGTKVEVKADGSKTITKPDGTKIEVKQGA